MANVENRNEVRINNQIQLLNILRNKKATVTDLAARLGISFTAASNIIEELVNAGLIKYSSIKQTSKKRGRTPVFVEMNCNNGVICGIDFSTWNIQVVIANMEGKVICKEHIPNTIFITQEHLNQIEEIIKRLLAKPEVKGRKLLSICISSPGLIRPNFEYASAYRIPNFEKLNPVLFFSNAFNVKVDMYNDIRISSLAEMKYGVLQNKSTNALFAHIGTGCGYSFIFDGKVYKGANGFAGECPSYTDSIGNHSMWNTRLFGIWDILMTLGSLSTESENYHIDQVNLDELFDKYTSGDEKVTEVVNESAKINALTIIGLCSTLDFEYVVIEGPILKFGPKYLELLRKNVIELSINEVRARIVASELQEESSLLGICYQAVTSYLFDELEKMTRKRISNNKFKLDESFNDI